LGVFNKGKKRGGGTQNELAIRTRIKLSTQGWGQHTPDYTSGADTREQKSDVKRAENPSGELEERLHWVTGDGRDYHGKKRKGKIVRVFLIWKGNEGTRRKAR